VRRPGASRAAARTARTAPPHVSCHSLAACGPVPPPPRRHLPVTDSATRRLRLARSSATITPPVTGAACLPWARLLPWPLWPQPGGPRGAEPGLLSTPARPGRLHGRRPRLALRPLAAFRRLAHASSSLASARGLPCRGGSLLRPPAARSSSPWPSCGDAATAPPPSSSFGPSSVCGANGGHHQAASFGAVPLLPVLCRGRRG